jgi:hypothetical protein
MPDYVHIVPGRLRIRNRLLRERRNAEHARRRICGIPGITSIIVNPATGSLLLSFDEAVIGVEALWQRLHDFGYVSVPVAPAGRSRQKDAALLSRDEIAGIVATSLVRAVAERSAAALIRALI